MGSSDRSSWIQAFDLVASYGAHSIGRANRSLITRRERDVGLSSAMWEAGELAVQTLINNSFPHPSIEELDALLPMIEREINDFLNDEFFPVFIEKVGRGEFIATGGASKDQIVEWWAEYGIAERALTFLQITDASPLVFHENNEMLSLTRSIAAVAALRRIDDCALACLFDGHGLDAAALDVGELIRRCRKPVAILRVIDEAMRDQRKAAAKKAVAARLDSDPKQAAKAGAFEWWGRWQVDPSLYPGPTAYATAMMDKFPELTNHASIMNWHRAWKAEPHEIIGGRVVKKT